MSIGFDADNIFVLFITIPCIIICVKKIKFVKNECFATKGVCISYDGSAGVTKLLSYNGTYKFSDNKRPKVNYSRRCRESVCRPEVCVNIRVCEDSLLG